jgi:PTS system mannose-specific IIA component
MVGILIVAHGTFGEALIHCASHVLGMRPPQILQLGVGMHDDPEALVPLAQNLVQQLDQGKGVLVFSDMLGATPCNIASRLLIPGKVEGISGINLPMLIRALSYRDEPLATVVAKAIDGGLAGVVQLNSDSCNAANRS